MELIINKLVIFSNKLKKSLEYSFNNGLNFIIGKNKSGKSSIAKSIMYTFGCDVEFEQEWINLENSYLLFYQFNGTKYSLFRQNLTGKKLAKGSNYFVLTNIDDDVKLTFSNVTELAEYFNKIFNFKIKLKSRDTGTPSQIFPNHMFLLNYVDQDTSWGTLLSDTFNKLNFLTDFRSSVTEYLLGYRNNDYYELLIQKELYQSELNQLNQKINNLKEFRDKNSLDLNAVEDIDVDVFKQSYVDLINRYENVLKKENEYKIEVSQLYENLYFYQNKTEENIGAINRIRKQKEIENCPICKKDYDLDVKKNYLLENSIFELENILKEDKISIEELKKQILKKESEINNIYEIAISIESKLKDKEYKLEFIKKMSDLGVGKVLSSMNKEIMKLRDKHDNLHKKYKEVIVQLKKVEKNKEVLKAYNSQMNAVCKLLGVKYSAKQEGGSPFLNFRYNFSGTDKNKVLIAFYIVVNTLMKCNEKEFPFIMDTPFKEDFTNENIIQILDVLTDNFNTENSQQCLIFTSSNELVKNKIDTITANKIFIEGERSLFNQSIEEKLKTYSKNISAT